MLECQLEYERVRLEAKSRKACLESQEKVHVDVSCNHSSVWSYSFLQERLRAQLASSLSLNCTVFRQSSTESQVHVYTGSIRHWASSIRHYRWDGFSPVVEEYYTRMYVPINFCRVIFLRNLSMLPVRVGGVYNIIISIIYGYTV